MSSTRPAPKNSLWLYVLLWLLALVLALASMVYQRSTGPTRPQRGSFTLAESSYEYSLPRSDWSVEKKEAAGVSLPDPGNGVEGRLHWRRYRTGDAFAELPLLHIRKDGEALLVGLLPAQPAAGKLEYFLTLAAPGGEFLQVPPPEVGTVVIRFKDFVPTGFLLPHVVLMALSILLGLRAGLSALFAPKTMRLWAGQTLLFITVGGMILGPIVQKYAFGEYWTGWPLGGDWTDNKALFMWLVWLVAVVFIGKRSRKREGWSRLAVGLATLAMMAVYLIPHSMGGSELDYDAVDRGITPSEAIRTGR